MDSKARLDKMEEVKSSQEIFGGRLLREVEESEESLESVCLFLIVDKEFIFLQSTYNALMDFQHQTNSMTTASNIINQHSHPSPPDH